MKVRLAVLALSGVTLIAQQPTVQIPGNQLAFGAFVARFAQDGSFTLEGEGWPPFKGTWKTDGAQIELLAPRARDGCAAPARYRFQVDGTRVTFDLVSDTCEPRRMILDHSTWRPKGEPKVVPERRIVRTVADRTPLPSAAESRTGTGATASRTRCVWRRRRAAASRHVERQDPGTHSLACSDRRARAFEPDRLGRSDLRDQRDQQRSEGDIPPRPLR
jgi:hypothetical protein